MGDPLRKARPEDGAQTFYARRGGTELLRETHLIDGQTVTDILLSFPSLPDNP